MPNLKFELQQIQVNGYRTIAGDGVNLNFADQKHLVLIGSNGSGKSNILNAISLDGMNSQDDNEPHADDSLPYSFQLKYLVSIGPKSSQKQFEITKAVNDKAEYRILVDQAFRDFSLKGVGGYLNEVSSALDGYKSFQSTRANIPNPKAKTKPQPARKRVSNNRIVNTVTKVNVPGLAVAIQKLQLLNEISNFLGSVDISKVENLEVWNSNLVLTSDSFDDPDAMMGFLKRKLSGNQLNSLKNLLSAEPLSQSRKSNLITSINKALIDLTKPLKNFELHLNLSSQADLSKLQIETKQNEFTVGMPNRSDGERAIIAYLLMLEKLVDSANDNTKILLFDEIEKSLDPENQAVLAKLISEIEIPNLHIIFSTHSPFMFFEKVVRQKVKVFAASKEVNITKIQEVNSGDDFKLNYPTWAEMNFVAYGIQSVQYHNELYGQLVVSKDSIMKTDRYLFRLGLPIKDYTKSTNSGGIEQLRCNHTNNCPNGHTGTTKYDITCVTLPTFIRHTTHHPENTHNPEFTPEELVESISLLRQHC